MQDELIALAKISEIDSAALATDTELEELPAKMAELDGDVQKLGELLAAERQELQEAESLLQEQAEELNNQSQALARSKAKSARASNMREADAVERELEVIRRSMKEREEERDKLKAAIEKRRGSLDKHEQEFAELQKFVDDEKQKAEARLSELRATRESVLAGREELAAKVPKQILRRYEMVRSKRAGLGAVVVRGDVCTGCHTALTPSQSIAVKRGETFEQCPRCNRLLFSTTVMTAASELKTGSAPQAETTESAGEAPADEQATE
ncbi:MAG: C4-type zinc ribbon domain-containing protein [Myxococcales bacterium]